MKNRIFARVLSLAAAVMLLLCALPAQADFGTLYVVFNCPSAPLYADMDHRTVLRYVNAGEVVYCIKEMSDMACVGYENSLGYIDAAYLAPVDDAYYSFRLPSGDMSGADLPYTEYYGVPYFAYAPLPAKATQSLATRTGPGTEYTGGSTYPKNTEITVYYETNGSGVAWVYIGFSYRGQDHLLYTGEKRVKTDYQLSGAAEEKFPVTILQNIVPRLGPGTNYALAEHSVPFGSQAEGVYRTASGWLMFDYRLPDGKIQRAWAPPQTWQ